MIPFNQIDQSFTLFLDRDGVLNHEKHNDYIYNRSEFIFYDGVPEAMQILARRFGRIIIVTNQRGIEKKLMTVADLHDVHDYMQEMLREKSVAIDAIFYCSSLDNNHPDRKPQTGMAMKAKAQFPDIDFSKSVMVGNNLSDMQFGRNAGMYTVFLQTTSPGQPLPDDLIDVAFKDLLNFALALQAA